MSAMFVTMKHSESVTQNLLPNQLFIDYKESSN
jgi:hypothetical protein